MQGEVLVTTRESIRTDPRMAGAVRRYHTWPTIQTQTVAEASWNVARILMMIWDGATAPAIGHALMNDCGELLTGDLPFPVKRDNPELKKMISDLETQSFREQGILELAEPHNMAILWQKRVKICDMLEMWEFGLVELAMGNQYAHPIVDQTIEYVHRLCAEWALSEDDTNRIRGYISWRKSKTP